jgi:flavin reductase (DIM6/NTAB) family NADH-FMN oxidoreductase RutF
MAVLADEFRAALARWASGVSIVTARQAERQVGMTVSAFSSVSLTPALVLVCASHSSETCAVIQATGLFAVNILAQHQRELSQRFSNPALEGKRFDGLLLKTGPSGLPLLTETAASLECRVAHSSVQGDHRVFIGEVLHTDRSDRAPLVFLQGSYGAFTTTD